MRTTPVTGLSELVELVRASRKRHTSTSSPDQASPDEASESHDLDRLKDGLKVALASLDILTDAGRRAAQRTLIAEIVAWEFGPAVRQHAEFDAMIDAIAAALDRDPRTARKVAKVLDDALGR